MNVGTAQLMEIAAPPQGVQALATQAGAGTRRVRSDIFRSSGFVLEQAGRAVCGRSEPKRIVTAAMRAGYLRRRQQNVEREIAAAAQLAVFVAELCRAPLTFQPTTGDSHE